jgi:hypothetical protein
MDANQALAELRELSSQVERAVVLDADGSLAASTEEDGDTLARAALDLLEAASSLRSSAEEVTRAEVELREGGFFVLRERGRTIAATTGPSPTSGLVAYDLRTCLHGLDEGERERQGTESPEEGKLE